MKLIRNILLGKQILLIDVFLFVERSITAFNGLTKSLEKSTSTCG